MILKIALYFVIVNLTSVAATQQCLLGSMTDVQDWVTEDGRLTERKDKRDTKSVDLSGNKDAVQQLQKLMKELSHANNYSSGPDIVSLSMARCNLTGVPQIFNLKNSRGSSLAETLQYLTFYDNNFHQSSDPATFAYQADFNATQAVEYTTNSRQTVSNQWESGLQSCRFNSLLELDLRSCCIRVLRSNSFHNMPVLEALYLSDNSIIQIEEIAFRGLTNLIHLDLSNNNQPTHSSAVTNIQIDSAVFRALRNLGSLDFSNTRLSKSNAALFENLPDGLRRLSICNAAITSLNSNCFSKTNLQFLDISGNTQMLSTDSDSFLHNFNRTLKVLYADRTALQRLNSFRGFANLEILKISNNAITSVPIHVASTWKKLRVLDLTANRIPSWFEPQFKLIPQLEFLSLMRNNLNMISEIMINDLKDLKYIGLSDNYFVCSCHVREFMEAAIKTESISNAGLITNYDLRKYGRNRPRTESPDDELEESQIHQSLKFHTGYDDYESMVNNRLPATIACDEYTCRSSSLYNTSYLLFDYDKNAYRCYIVNDDVRNEFMQVGHCEFNDRSLPHERDLRDRIVLLVVVVCVPLFALASIAVVMFRRWWCIKYFCITVKNSAMLSLISDEEKNIGTDGIYHYDVFVSYCNEDRAWVLDQLLPHVERGCNVSVCLHERDFQVGQSILENIVSCMDRSRLILLVISNKFLMSQWCQFEMHLAQHRLLETRREDLILVLLEDIPRMRRPHTLHYLMMTKTYIVWPRSNGERDNFWRRLKKSLSNKTAIREVATDA